MTDGDPDPFAQGIPPPGSRYGGGLRPAPAASDGVVVEMAPMQLSHRHVSGGGGSETAPRAGSDSEGEAVDSSDGATLLHQHRSPPLHGSRRGRRKGGGAASEAADVAATRSPGGHGHGFPVKAVSIISLSQLVNALSITSLFPYIGFMVQDLTGIEDEREVGFQAGYLAGAFMLGRILTSTYWGIWMDKHGRKPVLAIGCVGVAVTSIAFGFSMNFWWALIFRFLNGVLNAISTAGKACAAEVCGPEYQAKAMSIITGAWGVGMVMGPAIGGLLSRPHLSKTEAFHALAPEGSLLRDFPYLLPNIVVTVMAVAAVFFLRYLPETLVKSPTRAAQSSPSTGSASGADTGSKGAGGLLSRLQGKARAPSAYAQLGTDTPRLTGLTPKATELSMPEIDIDIDIDVDEDVGQDGGGSGGLRSEPRESLDVLRTPVVPSTRPTSYYDRPLYKQPLVMWVVAVYTCMSLIQITWDEVFPLWAIVPIDKGGLAMDTTEIGEVMTIMGVGLLVFQVTLFPCIANRLGARKTFIWGCFGSIPVMYFFPVSGLLHTDLGRVLAIVAFAFWKNGCAMAMFTSVFMLINRTVPSSRRGAVNGFSQTVSSIGKGVAPALAGNLFAWSEKAGLPFPLDMHLVYLVCGTAALALAITSALCLSKRLDEQASHDDGYDGKVVVQDADTAPTKQYGASTAASDSDMDDEDDEPRL